MLDELILQKEEMPGVQRIDSLTSVMLYQDVGGSFDAGIMTGIVFLGVLKVRKTEIIDRDLLWLGCRKGWIGEYLDLELPIGCLCFGTAALSQHDFLAFYIDAIIAPVCVDRGHFDGF